MADVAFPTDFTALTAVAASGTDKLLIYHGGRFYMTLTENVSYVRDQLVDTDVSLAGNSDSFVPSQKAVKTYIDSTAAGKQWKDPVRVATTANGTLASAFENGDTVDGVTLATNDRILLKDQSDQTKNGIYTVNASGAPTRATDCDADDEFPAATVKVLEGTTNAGREYTCNNPTVTVGSTNVTFVRTDSGVATYAGDETTIHLSGNTFNVIDNSVTYAKMQNVSATKRVVGRNTSGAGDPEEVTATQLLDWIGSPAQGSTLVRGSSNWGLRSQAAQIHVNATDSPFNAVGDGSTDNTAAAAALAALGDGYAVFWPQGTYKMDNVTIDSAQDWYGAGMQRTVFKPTAGASGALVRFTNSTAVQDARLHDLTIDITARPLMTGLYVHNMQYSLFENVWIQGGTKGVDIGSAGSGPASSDNYTGYTRFQHIKCHDQSGSAFYVNGDICAECYFNDLELWSLLSGTLTDGFRCVKSITTDIGAYYCNNIRVNGFGAGAVANGLVFATTAGAGYEYIVCLTNCVVDGIITGYCYFLQGANHVRLHSCWTGVSPGQTGIGVYLEGCTLVSIVGLESFVPSGSAHVTFAGSAACDVVVVNGCIFRNSGSYAFNISFQPTRLVVGNNSKMSGVLDTNSQDHKLAVGGTNIVTGATFLTDDNTLSDAAATSPTWKNARNGVTRQPVVTQRGDWFLIDTAGAATPNGFGTLGEIHGLTTAPVCQGRLTLESGVFNSITDQTGKSTLYFVPYNGRTISLYYSSTWFNVRFSEFAYVPTLTSGKNYDVFVAMTILVPSSTNTGTDVITWGSAQDFTTGSMVTVNQTGGGLTAGTVYFYNAASSTTGTFHTTLANALAGTSKVDLSASITAQVTAVYMSLSAAWTNDTTRADALTGQDNLVVKNGATNLRNVGLIRASGTNTMELSQSKMFVWNRYNPLPRFLGVGETTNSWQRLSSDGGIRQANGSGGNKVEFITGEAAQTLIEADLLANVAVRNNTTVGAKVGIGIDSTSTFTGQSGIAFNAASTAVYMPLRAQYRGYMTAPGYHYLSWNEKGADTNCDFLGDNGGDDSQSGLYATIWG